MTAGFTCIWTYVTYPEQHGLSAAELEIRASAVHRQHCILAETVSTGLQIALNQSSACLLDHRQCHQQVPIALLSQELRSRFSLRAKPDHPRAPNLGREEIRSERGQAWWAAFRPATSYPSVKAGNVQPLAPPLAQ